MTEEEARAAFAVLDRAEASVELGPTGIAADELRRATWFELPSPEARAPWIRAFVALLADPPPRAELDALLADRSPVTRLYAALLGRRSSHHPVRQRGF